MDFQPLLKNRLAQLCFNWSGHFQPEVLLYLENWERLKDEPEKLEEFEKNYKSSHLIGEFFCIVTHFCNERPYLAICATLALCYNLVYWSAYYIQKYFFA
jgi:hypothetical protein